MEQRNEMSTETRAEWREAKSNTKSKKESGDRKREVASSEWNYEIVDIAFVAEKAHITGIQKKRGNLSISESLFAAEETKREHKT